MKQNQKFDMSRAFKWSEISEGRRHIYFYTILLLVTLLAVTLKNCVQAGQQPERKELANGVRHLLETGKAAKDLY